MTKIRRTNFYVKKKFQSDFFIKFAMLLILEAVLFSALFIYVSKGTLTAAYHGADFTIQRTAEYFFADFIVVILIVGAAVGFAGIFVFMYLSHRIGGALYRFERTLLEAKKGNLSQRIRLRKTDELMEVKNSLNSLLETLDGDVSHIKKEICSGIDALNKARGFDDMVIVRETLRNIKASLARYKTTK